MFHRHHLFASLHRANSFLASQLEEIKPEEYFNEPVRIEKWTMSEHVRSWASTQELIEEVNHILTEKRTGQSNEGPESLTGSGNKEDSERSVSDGTHKGESDGILATKKEVLVTLDWDSVDGLLREISRRDKASESSASIKTFLEEFNATLQEEFENKVWTYGDTMEDLPRKEVLLPPPLPSLLLHPPAHPPNVSFAFLKFSVDAAVPVRHNGDQENVFGPPIPIVLPPAPSAPPPPSIQVIKEDVDRIPAENFSIVVPTAWNVKEEFLPGNALLLPPPPSPPVWLGPPQLHTDTLILHSLPIVRLPEGFKLEPIGVLNGEILYGIAPLNAGRRKSNLSTSSRVRGKRDDGRPYIKKPPNAFMLFLKEIRPKVVSELNIRGSGTVTRVVGEMWNCLPVEVKAKYFQKARLGQELHRQQHPGWSTNANYGQKRKWGENETSESSSSSACPPQCPFHFSIS
ncbi:uncharacterized protein LOC122819265 isoform X2 [Gambusia affinis]|uniref:uncharacterized protein LOC122819265 isoform X2 n=1 Tax=Gambusia affinis TaxID=33528 RepID=UPI001CDCE323|nr:uncharacterized protein LOC122819265 isoform X2 [Gambusia affinis]